MFCYLVPDGPPLNVILSSPTSTSINVKWNHPDPLLRNGIITKHQLNYTEASQPSNWTIMELNESTYYLIVTGFMKTDHNVTRTEIQIMP